MEGNRSTSILVFSPPILLIPHPYATAKISLMTSSICPFTPAPPHAPSQPRISPALLQCPVLSSPAFGFSGLGSGAGAWGSAGGAGGPSSGAGVTSAAGTGAGLSAGTVGCSVAGGCSGAGGSSAAGAGADSSFGVGTGSFFGVAGAGSVAGGAVLPVIVAKPGGWGRRCFAVSTLGSLLCFRVPAPDQRSLLQIWDLNSKVGVPALDQASPLWTDGLCCRTAVLGGGNQVTEPEQGLGDFYRLRLALVTSLQTNMPAQAETARNSHPGPAHSAAHPYPLLWDCSTWSCPPPPSPQAHTGLGKPGPGHLSSGTWLLSPAPTPL